MKREIILYSTVLFMQFLVCDVESKGVGVCLTTVSVVKTKWKGGRRVQYADKVKQETCCDGWFWNKKEQGCTPKCEQGCDGGTCVEHNVCRCPPTLLLKDNNKCVPPKCTDPCVNALCVNDDECMCNPDYIPVNATHCGPQCSSNFHIDPISLNCTCDVGYRIDPFNNTNCLPVCDPACQHATCIAPNTCSCLPGHVNVTNTTCVPKCDDCDGICIGPNICQCFDGYAFNSVGKCVPKCSKPCVNGYCFGPETCACDSGYQPDEDDPYQCVPVCKTECVNAVCVAPNKCACNPGYEGSDEGFDCQPVCKKPCKNGVCIAPEICRCNDGYSLEAGECSPVCNESCVNGRCVAPDTCECDADYLKNASDPSVCYKPCSQCEHGTCSLDGECFCHRGYGLENDTCVELKPVNCETCNGTCADECWCLDDKQPCFLAQSAEVAPTTTLAGMELSWVVAGAIILLLVVVLIVVLQRIYSRRKKFEHKVATDYNAYGSVVYTVPNTLTRGFDETDEDEKDKRSVYENVEDEKQAQKLLHAPEDNEL